MPSESTVTPPPLPSFGRQDVSEQRPSPFAPQAQSPFQAVGQWIPPRPQGSPPRTRSQSPATPRRKPALGKPGLSPVTPGGTRVPDGPPPDSPPSIDRVSSGEGARDYVPGDRTMWELPKLGSPNEPNPALRCSDWLHRIQPPIHDLAPKAHVWWTSVVSEARSAYSKWVASSPLERIAIKGEPSDGLKAEKFLRLESRALAMLSKAVPQTIYDYALSVRNTTCVGLVFFVLKAFQPGGLHERTELLKGLTSLQECNSARQGVDSLNMWFRHLERARGMNVAVPDCTLLLDALDTMSKQLLERSPALLFRMNTTRMTLQLDTVPTLPTVEQFARSLMAELEVLAVSGNDTSANKKQRIASLTSQQPPKGGEKGGQVDKGGEPSTKKGQGKAKTPCHGWASDAGCRYGRNCQFSHDLERPQKCWTCGGSHMKADCTAPGGGKGPPVEPKAKAKVQTVTPSKGKEKGEAKPPKTQTPKHDPPKQSNEAAAAIKEATQLLQSMRIARLDAHIKAVSQVRDLSSGARRKGLIDGGATACLRSARSDELTLPTLEVALACGTCSLHVNQAGTLLSPRPVAPIVSVAALLELGYRIQWSKEHCQISHPTHGQLQIDATSGCPEVDYDVALRLISEYEALVKEREVHEARVSCLLSDLKQSTDEELAQIMWNGGVEAAAALRLLAARLFNDTDAELLKQIPVSLCQAGNAGGWNRRARRRAERSDGVVVYLGDKESKRALDAAVDRCGWTLLHADVFSRAMSEAEYAFLLELAQKGHIRAIVSGPPYRSFSGLRYVSTGFEGECQPENSAVRIRGQSIGSVEGAVLTGPEAAARRSDDVLMLRIMLLHAVASGVCGCVGLPEPAFLLEQPEDQPETEAPSFWMTPEWKRFAKKFQVDEVSFDQGPLMHLKRRPTTLASNLPPSERLVDCRGSGLEVVHGVGAKLKQGSGAAWAPGLLSAVAEMLWRRARGAFTKQVLPQVRVLDPGFIEHIKQGHIPFRNDCRFCVRGSARRKQHRRVLCPEAWSLSVDTAGPYKKGEDETVKGSKYLVVGVLTVPVIALSDEEVAEPEEDPNAEEGGALGDEEIFAEGEDEPDEPLSAKELAEAKSNKTAWDELLQRDQQAWKDEAKKEHLPRVKLIEWPFVEPIAGKTQQNVLAAIRKMRAEAQSLGFEVKRLHTDRGREYNNSGLRNFCNQHSIVKTLAFAEEHQSNGRVESLIGRVKAKTRVFLEQGGAPAEEWPMAARLAEVVLQNIARSKLNMKARPIVPYNSQVQVIQRSWRRGAWHSITVSARTKGPSADSDRGWVVVTTEGNVLSTSKLFPSPEDHKKLVIKYEGEPIDPDAPERRLRAKTAVRTLSVGLGLADPKHQVDVMAQEFIKDDDYSPTAMAKLAIGLSKLSEKTHGSMPVPVKVKEKGTVFFSGGYSFGGITGLKNNATDHPWVTAYVAQYLQRITSEPFAAIGLVWNAEHEPHRDVHNQKGIKNIVVPVVTSGGGIWVQDEGLDQEQKNSDVVKKEVKPGLHVNGRVVSYKPEVPVSFDASKWHASEEGAGQQLLVLGYTPRSLHKLGESDRKRLWDLGFPFIPASSSEFWTFDRRRSILTKHHPVPRKPLFVPKAGELPFPLENLGNIRYYEQRFVDGSISRHMHQWRHNRANVAVRMKWTGKSVFQLTMPNQDCVDLGGVLLSLCPPDWNRKDFAGFARTSCQTVMGLGGARGVVCFKG